MSRSLGLSLAGSLSAGVFVIRSFSGAPSPSPVFRFTDVARRAGIDVPLINGGAVTKKYAFESTGSGVALIDYDRDGYPDIFLVNGSRLEASAPNSAPTNHLFHNNRDGTFTDVTARAGVASSGWGQGACV